MRVLKRLLVLGLTGALATLPSKAAGVARYHYLDSLPIRSGPASVSDGLARASDGYYWGASTGGGAADTGCIFKLKADGSGFQIVYSFTSDATGTPDIPPNNPDGAAPYGPLVEDAHGFVWGVATAGGKEANGTIFKIHVATGAFTRVATIPSNGGGGRTGLVDDGRGYYWWGAYNSLFKVQMTTGRIFPVLTFTGAGGAHAGDFPTATPVKVGNFLWGTTQGYGNSILGTIYKVDVTTGAFTTVAQFTGTTGPTKGSAPAATMVSDGHGNLWGSTTAGGADNFGTLFKVNTTTDALVTMVEFTGASGVAPGSTPFAPLVADGAGAFWGTTSAGGSANLGVLFKIDIATGTYHEESAFMGTNGGTADTGANPFGGLVPDGNGHLIGTTGAGGSAERRGEVYQVNLATGSITTLRPFTGNGLSPQTALTADAAGNLWGALGGATDNGYYGAGFYELNAQTGAVKYNGSDLSFNAVAPVGTLYFDGANTFWGTLQPYGFATSYGSIYTLDATTGAATDRIDFTGTGGATPGANPATPLVPDGNGNLWGSTAGGGANNDGTIFKIRQSTATLTTVAQLDGTQGSAPGPLYYDGAGFLWGAAATGGSGGGGTIFKVNTATGAVSAVAEFQAPALFTAPASLSRPSSGLTSDGAGNLWGIATVGGPTAAEPASGNGGIYKIQMATGAVTNVVTFTGNAGEAQGSTPVGELVNDGAGYMWGVTSGGGRLGNGTVYKVEMATGHVTTVVDFGGVAATPNPDLHPAGKAPLGPLCRTANGDFYGVTAQGPNGGVLYRIAFDGAGPAAPLADTFQVDALAIGAATLAGDATPYGLATTAFFEYGLTARYGLRTPAQSLGAGLAPVNLTAAVTHLRGHATYHYRTVAMNKAGLTYGADATFTTPDNPPVASDETVLTSGPVYYRGHPLRELPLPEPHVFDVDGDRIQFVSQSLGMFGMEQNGFSFVGLYNPGPNYKGFDALTYSVADGHGGTASANIYLINKLFDGLLTSAGTDPGYMTVMITAAHGFSASLKLSGTTYRLGGAFNAQNHYSGTFLAHGAAAPVAVSMDLDLAHGAITASVNNGAVYTSTLLNSISFTPGEVTQKYTALLPAPADGALPQGTGYGVMNISRAGFVTIAGKLGDGTAYSVGAPVRDDGNWIFYAPIAYAATRPGLVVGTASFAPLAGSDCSASLSWTKPPTAGAFAAGFSTSVELTAALYEAPVRGHQALTFSNTASGQASFTLAGGDAGTINHSLLVSANNAVTVTNPGPDKLALTIVPVSGVVAGTFISPATGKKVAIGGVLQQKENIGAGVFSGADQTGSFRITPE